MEVGPLPLDTISNLPSSIIQIILTLLPMRDAFRTSILSRTWRYRCLSIPKLEFDDKLFQGSTHNQLSIKCKLVHVIYTVLLLHHDPVLEFSLRMSQLQSCCEIDLIILHLVRKTSVEKFTLCIGSGNDHKLPSSFFSLKKLTHLKLQNCAIQSLSAFCGFSRLISLYFHNVSITTKVLLRFISDCPQLKSFTLIEDDKHLTGGGYSDFVELFECLPLIEHLHMNCYAVKCFAAGVIPQRLPSALVRLKVLNLSDLSFVKEDELYSALLLISSSPNIEKITMQMYHNTREPVSQTSLNLLDLQDYSYVILNHLRVLEIRNFANLKPGMEFVKLILAKSSMLKQVRLVINSQIAVNDEVKMLRDLLKCPRASSKAQIIFEGP